MDLLIVFAVVLAVAAFVGAPLRGRARGLDPDAAARAELADLEAAKEAKYQEIRDAELDQRTGKLSERGPPSARRGAARGGDRAAQRIDALRARSDAAPRTPLRPSPSRRRRPSAKIARSMYTILAVIQVIIAVVLILLILMHSGRDTGLSGAFGVGTGSGPFGGGSLVERNLNRWTVFFAVVFGLNTIVLLKI